MTKIYIEIPTYSCIVMNNILQDVII